jgi:hypothetical protein
MHKKNKNPCLKSGGGKIQVFDIGPESASQILLNLSFCKSVAGAIYTDFLEDGVL